MPNPPVMIVAGLRVPQARQNGALLNATPAELAGLVASAVVERSALPRDLIHGIYWGVMYQTEGDSVHLPRYAGAAAGVPGSVPSVLVNRLCGSGLEALIQGSRAILLGEAGIVLAGSTDCITRAAQWKLSSRYPLHESSSDDDPVTASTLDRTTGKRMAELAECFCRKAGIGRAQLDEFALQSRRRAVAAQEQGFFDLETIPVGPAILKDQRLGAAGLDRDQIESRWPAPKDLAVIESRYGGCGCTTRGNSSAFADGAAALLLASQETVQQRHCVPLAMVRAWAVTASEPCDMGGAMVSAIKQVISAAGLSLDRIDWIELEEAFSVNCVYAIRELGLNTSKVNPSGGALALGHPPATAGLRQILCASYGLKRIHGRFALVALAAAGSQGMALIIETAG